MHRCSKVATFAGILTGWSVGRDGLFEFRDAWHEPGASTMPGKRDVFPGSHDAKALRDLVRSSV